ncbi:sulfite exporter TauE/SafE family protein [Aquipuribacter nitratireducens]|uniref:Probable membrane transporter protein n=1 Tax=Aquipuribacter nitratireducens TaxID=650104 RepID=A0ABW0GMP1_9MICO
MLVALVVAAAVLLGAVAQRVSGMGFALVLAPVLVLAVGPVDGVLMVNVCGAASSCLVITRVWRLIDWRQYALLAVPALVAVIPGALVAARLGGPVLQVSIGVLVVVALTLSLVVTGNRTRTAARLPTGILSGAASGFMSATAGVSGPTVSIYAVLTRWEHRQFAATVQPVFATLGLAAFVGKAVALPEGLPEYQWWLWPLILACTVAGLAVGERLAAVVSPRAARVSVIALAYGGGVVAVLDGLGVTGG